MRTFELFRVRRRAYDQYGYNICNYFEVFWKLYGAYSKYLAKSLVIILYNIIIIQDDTPENPTGVRITN